MNYFVIIKLLGLLLSTVGLSMLPSLLWSLYYEDGAEGAISLALVITCAVGATLYFIGRSRRQEMFRKEATAVVGFSWLLTAFFGALPFYFSGTFPSFIDCFFEAMSGLTTTGASVMTDFDAPAAGIHFWRCFLHWLGGMGIIVLFVALLPFLGAGGRVLLKYEVPGPVTESLTPRVKDTAILLWKLYLAFTLLETVILMFCGLSLFDALCHTFATLATGGFSTHPASIAGFHSIAIEITILFFMVVAGTNFSLYYSMVRGTPSALFRDPEWRTYIALLACSTGFVTLMLYFSGVYAHVWEALRYGSFQVVSLMTTTGFVTANFDAWPVSVKILLVSLMFVGGSAGSTGGGIKVMRWIILAKVAFRDIERVYSPRTVRKLRIGDALIDDDLKVSTLSFFLIWVFIFVAGSFVVGILEGPIAGPTSETGVNMITVLTAVAATLNNIGPGLGLVGAVENYASFHPSTKLLLSLFMVVGRLELYTILILMAPRFWRVR